MSDIPTPKSYASILGDMIDTVTARLKLSGMNVGDATLTLLEAAAQSDFRNSHAIFSLLNGISLERASGDALDRIGADEDVTRIPATASSGTVRFIDTRYTKISTAIYAGLPPIQAGTNTINVSDASKFPSTGSIYIGRGTVNFEGPLAYTSVSNAGNYWTITLSGSTSNFHNVLETVILAQGGDRIIPAGTIVQTSQTTSAEAILFSTLSLATIPDGETYVDGVSVTCQTAGVIGNVVAGAINTVSGSPFPGASVTNLLPISNGYDAQHDDSYRDAIRNARQTRAKGTSLAITTGATGVLSKDENKRVQSASLVQQSGTTATLYIDDGSGYEESTAGVGLESIVDLAYGGEQYFQLASARPVSKAFVKTSITAPYLLVDGAILSVSINGKSYQHSFSSVEFKSINNATAYEVVASINKDSSFPVNARTAENGTKVVLTANVDTNEDIQVTTPPLGTDANTYLGFPTSQVYSLKLYKNDQLLYKDGKTASIYTAPQSAWNSSIGTSGSETIVVAIDGTPNQTITITGSDFSAANTGYTTISKSNSLDSWAAVFNYKIPGITATVSGNQIIITSNLGTDSRAQVKIVDVGGSNTLFTKGMFSTTYSSFTVSGTTTTLYANGQTSDYTLDRNTAQIKLSSSLSANDSLTAGSIYTRAYLQSSTITGLTIGSSNANLWFAVDGGSSILSTLVTTSGSITVAQSSNGAPFVRYTFVGSGIVNGYVLAGDWVVIWDPNLLQHGLTAQAYKICSVGTSGGNDYFEVEFNLPGGFSSFSGVPSSAGIVFVRTSSRIQKISVPALTSGLTSIVSSLNGQLVGATASVQPGNKIRVTTNTFGSNGDIMLVTADSSGQTLKLPSGKLVVSQPIHLAYTESVNGESDQVYFDDIAYTSTGNVYCRDPFVAGNASLVWRRPILASDSAPRMGTNSKDYTTVQSITSVSTRSSSCTFTSTTATVTVTSTASMATNDYVSIVFDSSQVIPNGLYGPITVINATSFSFPYANGTIGTASFVGTIYVHKATLRSDYTSIASVVGDRYGFTSNYAFGPNDDLSVIVDGDAVSQNYSIPMYRRVQATSTSYVQSNITLVDLDNSSQALWKAFGDNFDFSDYAVYMQARAITDPSDSTKKALWRFSRLGPEGNNVQLVYDYPTSANAAPSVTIANGDTSKVSIRLASGAARSSPGWSNDTALSMSVTNSGNYYTYTYVAGFQVAAGGITSAGGGAQVSVTVTLPPGYTAVNQILSVNNYIYFTGGDTQLPSGTYQVTVINSSTNFNISATVSGSAYTSATTYNLAFTNNSSSVAANVDFGAAGIVANDIVSLSSSIPFASTDHAGTFRVTAVSTKYFQVMAALSLNGNTEKFVSIGSTSNIAFYPLNASSNTVNNLVSSTTSIVSGATPTAGSGTGTITQSTQDQYNLDTTKPQYYTLAGGVNFVQSSNVTSVGNNSSITLKIDPTVLESSISGSNTILFTNETIHLVPTTAKSIVNYLSSAAVSGIYANSSLARSSGGKKIQISTKTAGSSGSVQVTGGASNLTTASVVGTGTSTTYTSKVTISKSLDKGFIANSIVTIQAATAQAKNIPALSDSTQSVTIADLGGNPHNYSVTFNSTTAVGNVYATTQATEWMVEKQGSLAYYIQTKSDGTVTHFNQSNVVEGDLVYIKGTAFSSGNRGVFRIVRVTDTGFWVENISAVEEVITCASGDIVITSYDSVLPGDVLSIVGSFLGASNMGQFTVVSGFTLPSSGNYYSFNVVGSMSTVSGVSLSGNTSSIQIIEQTPRKLYKIIKGIAPNSTDSTNYTDIIFTTPQRASEMNSAAKSYITVLNKLSFPTSLVQGLDGYAHTTGLIAEVNKVIYGSEDDPATYPGIVAAGANVNIAGPFVKRIQVSLAIRTKSTGISTVKDRVKSAVASVINGTGIGQPIAISSLTNAASKVDGVVSVAVISPTYSSSNDLISLQPFEKPLVLDIDNDILINIIGS